MVAIRLRFTAVIVIVFGNKNVASAGQLDKADSSGQAIEKTRRGNHGEGGGRKGDEGSSQSV